MLVSIRIRKLGACRWLQKLEARYNPPALVRGRGVANSSIETCFVVIWEEFDIYPTHSSFGRLILNHNTHI